MKNQYVGDVGDFGKYSLLRILAEKGIKVGVNWYLTEDDGSNDGKFTDYLEKGKLRRYCPIVFDALADIAYKSDKSVKDIELSGIIPGAVFYSELLRPVGIPDERRKERRQWFQESMSKMSDADLIFMDPDNGLLESNDATKRDAEKYVLPDEVEQYYNAGHDVVYYCHKGRRTWKQWEAYKSFMLDRIKDSKPIVLTYHKGSQRSYVFLVHEKNYLEYHKIAEEIVINRWYKVFSQEFTSLGDITRSTVGEPFTFKKDDGTVITIQEQYDGWIQIRSSADRNTIRSMRKDVFCSFLGV